MKRVGMVETFTRNSIWARQKTIYLYPAMLVQTAEKPAHAAAIRPALSEVGIAGLSGQSRGGISVSGSSGVARGNQQHTKHLHV
jgi:hypothetical protein